MKKKILLSVIAGALFAVMCFAGCKDGKIYKSLTDLSEYGNLNVSEVSRIHVKWDEDGGGGNYVEFDIVNENDVKEIMHYYTAADAFYYSVGDHDGCDSSHIILYNGETELAKVSLFHIGAGLGCYHYSNNIIKNLIRISGESMDYFRGFFGLNLDIDNIEKVRAYIQQGDNWQNPTYTTFDLCEEENVKFIVEALSYRKAFITLNEPWDSNDLSYIEIYDNSGAHVTVMLYYGIHKMIADGVRELIYEYGVSNGYLQN